MAGIGMTTNSAELASKTMADLLRLDGRVAAVTGAARGIGFAIAKRLVDAGAAVVIADHDAAAVALAVKELGGVDVGILGVAADVTVDADVHRVLQAAIG